MGERDGRLTFSTKKKKSGSMKKGSDTRHFLIEGGDSKVYYFKEKPHGYETLLAPIDLNSSDGWFQLPSSTPSVLNTKIRLSKGRLAISSKTLVIQASHCSRSGRSLEYRLVFDSKKEAENCRDKLRARCPKLVDRRRRLTGSEILARRKRRPTSAEVVLGRLLEEIRRLQ